MCRQVLSLALMILLTLISNNQVLAQDINTPDHSLPNSSMADWVLVNTEHFSIVSNTSPERAKLIAYKLEQYRYALSQLMPELVATAPVPSRVQVHRDSSSYSTSIGKSVGVTTTISGYFQPGIDMISVNDLFNISDNVSFHEYIHLLNRFDNEYPLWFTEGIAQYFETFEITGQKVHIGEITTSKINSLKMGNLIPLKKLLAIHNYSEITRDYSIDTFYAQAWLLTHYLMMNDNRRTQLVQFLELLKAGKSGEMALTAAFQSNAERLDEELKNYLTASKFEIFAFDFDTTKVDTDVEVISLTEADKVKKVAELLEHREYNVRLTATGTSAQIKIIPDFKALTASLAIKTLPSNRPTTREISHTEMVGKTKEALDIFNQGNDLLEAGNLTAALAKYEQAVKLDAEFAPAYTSIGNIYAQQKSYDMAQRAYEQAREVAPDYAGTYLNLAVTQYEQGNAGQAEHYFRMALSLYPSSAASHLGLANIYLEKQDYAHARTEYTKTLNLVCGTGPEALNAHIGLGAIYFYQGNHQKAKEQYQQAIKLDPKNINWYRAYAENCRLLKEYDLAAAAYRQVLAMNAADSRSKEVLAWLEKYQEYQKLSEHYNLQLGRTKKTGNH